MADSCHVHSSLPSAAFDQVQGAGYSKSEVETDMVDLELETVGDHKTSISCANMSSKWNLQNVVCVLP
jgi:hypothetical protein